MQTFDGSLHLHLLLLPLHTHTPVLARLGDYPKRTGGSQLPEAIQVAAAECVRLNVECVCLCTSKREREKEKKGKRQSSPLSFTHSVIAVLLAIIRRIAASTAAPAAAVI